MTILFTKYKKEFTKHVDSLLKNQDHLFVTDVTREALWETYINSYPESVRQEFNCNCCRQFIKDFGNVVAIVNNQIKSIWSFFEDTSSVFYKVNRELETLVLSSPIRDRYLAINPNVGTDHNIQLLPDNKTIRWDHYSYTLDRKFVINNYDRTKSVAYYIAPTRDAKNVFKRSLDEITEQAVLTVLELIEQNSLYRGSDYTGILKVFLTTLKIYRELDETQKDAYCWSQCLVQSAAVSKIRNTAIGTLLVDISEDKELDVAISAFERIMDPSNHKRPNTVITNSMVKKAEEYLEASGLGNSLARRNATLDDIEVTDLIFVNRSSRLPEPVSLLGSLKQKPKFDSNRLSKVETVSLQVFLDNIVPTATNIELLLENAHESNLVSLITAENSNALPMFKWNNPFSWTYNGSVADSLREKVKKAGGTVEGLLRVSLGWYNFDDLDLHMHEPDLLKTHIYFRNKMSSFSRAKLDVDQNAGTILTRSAVENIIYPYNSTLLKNKSYQVDVHNFSKRETIDVGFYVEVEYNGLIYTFTYDKAVKGTIPACSFVIDDNNEIVFTTNLETSAKVKQLWNLNTLQMHKVEAIMYSPNYWQDNSVGNKHVFLMLEGAKNTEPTTRGFFNEFLHESLSTHRKVFEALGSRTNVSPSEQELSGVGFSLTSRKEFTVKVSGSFTRMLKVVV